MQNPPSPWALNAIDELKDVTPIWDKNIATHKFQAFLTTDTLWMKVLLPSDLQLNFRMVCLPGLQLGFKKVTEKQGKFIFTLGTLHGNVKVEVTFPKTELLMLHYTSHFKPSSDFLLPFSP